MKIVLISVDHHSHDSTTTRICQQHIYKKHIYKITSLFYDKSAEGSGRPSMGKNQDSYKRGTAEFLILYLLQKEEMYGYQITQTMAEKSGGRYTMLLGSLYLMLTRMEADGFVTSRTQLVGKKLTRRYYKITENGLAHLQAVLREYDEICKGVNLILDREVESDEQGSC